ncbi:hypothetical protein L6164_011942 [Bauhinia variegata]|uniref:Uncharacterized protein n=1 Tax=Bauhinia variegata TaxID=167791 RepID=A0ACB9P8P5_BAUVA|nr:hypothetical protein L6164_011942 [Bauhinia variegata]
MPWMFHCHVGTSAFSGSNRVSEAHQSTAGYLSLILAPFSFSPNWVSVPHCHCGVTPRCSYNFIGWNQK